MSHSENINEDIIEKSKKDNINVYEQFKKYWWILPIIFVFVILIIIIIHYASTRNDCQNRFAKYIQSHSRLGRIGYNM